MSLKRLQQFATLMDSSMRIPVINVRFGLDALIGLIPGLGDVVGAIFSSYILFSAARLGAPKSVLTKMALTIGLDSIVSMVPVIGDIFDIYFKANQRNVRLLERYLDSPGKTRRSSLFFVILLASLLLGFVIMVGVVLINLVGVVWRMGAGG